MDAVENNALIAGTMANEIKGKAPISHSSTDRGYGGGTANEYGHVKLSDNYTSSAGTATSSIGASSYAVAKVYQELASAVAKRLIVEDVSCTGIGQAWLYLSNKSGYKLISVYNGARQFNEVKVTAFEYDGLNNVYNVFFNISQPTTNNILLRCIWAQV